MRLLMAFQSIDFGQPFCSASGRICDSNRCRWQAAMNAVSGARKPRGLEGRGSRVDFFFVSARIFSKSGDGLDGSGLSQYGHKVLGSTCGAMQTVQIMS